MTAGLQVLNGRPGSIDTMKFQQDYPALAIKHAIDISKKSGLDPSDPRNIVQTMQSETYQSRVRDLQNGKDPGKVDIGTNSTPVTRHFTRAANPDSEISAGFQAKADALQGGINRRGQLQTELSAESERLSRMVDFDKEAYTNSKLAEMQPTASIDKAIMDIRNRALVDKARFFSDPEITALPFGLQEKVIGERMGMYTEQINDLADLRSARLEGAKAKIKGQLDQYGQRVEASKTRISAIEKSIEYAKADGADEQEIAQLRIDHAKEMQRLNKERDKGGMGSTPVELMANAMIQRYYKTYGVMPEGADLENITREAKLAVKTNQGLTSEVVRSGGQYDRMSSGDTPGLRTVGGDPFADAGFGQGLSATGRGRIQNLQPTAAENLKTTADLRKSVKEGYLVEEDLPVEFRRR